MDKQAIASVLEQIAAFLELQGENPFRVRAYHNAARAVRALSSDVRAALTDGALAESPGIGPATLEIVKELVASGRSSLLEDLKEHTPPDLVEMLRISGLGVAKVRQLHDLLGVDSLDDLEQAARDGRLAKLPRFGPKTAENILKGIAFLRRSSEYRLYHHARAEAEALCSALGALDGVRRASVAGSIRRRREIIRDIDIVLECGATRHAIVTRLANAPGVTEFTGGDEASVTLRFASGWAADVFLAVPDDYGTVLLRATGNDDHLGQLGELPLAADEAEVYARLGLAFVPPELREGQGEIEAARTGSLPRLVEHRDVRGFIHCHTNYSDGSTEVAEWAVACAAAGYAWMGVTDHSQSAAYAGGLTLNDIDRQHAEIDAVNAAHPGCHVLKGIEADILADGTLDFGSEVLARFDFVIGSIHARLGMGAEAMTARVLHAMDDPNLVILGHPTGRLLMSRDPIPIDIDAVLDKAVEVGVAIEVNADPHRLDLDWRLVRPALERGVTLSIGADAHNAQGIGNMEIGVGLARKGWATSDDVLNTRSLDAFLEHVARRRGR